MAEGVAVVAVVAAVATMPLAALAVGRALVVAVAPRPARAASVLQGRSSYSEVPAVDVAPLLRHLRRPALLSTLPAARLPHLLSPAWEACAAAVVAWPLVMPSTVRQWRLFLPSIVVRRLMAHSMIQRRSRQVFTPVLRSPRIGFARRVALLLTTTRVMPVLFLPSTSMTMMARHRCCLPAPYQTTCVNGCGPSVVTALARGGSAPLGVTPATGVALSGGAGSTTSARGLPVTALADPA